MQTYREFNQNINTLVIQKLVLSFEKINKYKKWKG